MRPRRLIFVLCLTCVVVLLCRPASALSEAGLRADRIRAALLYYVAKFIQWPEERSGTTDGPFTVCVLGDDAITLMLEETLADKSIHGQTAKVVNFQAKAAAAELAECRMVFVGAMASGEATSIVSAAHQAGKLTVCAGERQVDEARCVVHIFEAQNKAKVAVDLPLARRLQFRVSAELLEVAVVLE
ncbi:MAG: YfiR family protein [Bdellovibrionales bacterium]|nr:YfiR family protein [Bdellovibrionales bacterium]